MRWVVVILGAMLVSCEGGGEIPVGPTSVPPPASPPNPLPPTTPPTAPPEGPLRTFLMGFSDIPPRRETALANLEMWTSRSDAAIMHLSPPWEDLLSGMSATVAVEKYHLPRANYYRARNLEVVVMVDVTDGFNRAAETRELVRLGRSISEPEVQQVYRQYVLALANVIRPDYLGLAAETNLVRLIAPPSLYASLKQMVNSAAADLQRVGSTSKTYVSVQVDVAWGMGHPTNTYTGVEQDFIDFPFMQALGLSSYPYLVYADPDEIPLDYYSRLPNGRSLPVVVVEGGWPSRTVESITSTTGEQARYLGRQARMLDSVRAEAVFQLFFADLDIQNLNWPPASALFASLGLVDTELHPRPSLAVWDSLFAIRKQ